MDRNTLEAMLEKAKAKDAKAAKEYATTGNKRFLNEAMRQKEIMDLIGLAMLGLETPAKKEEPEREGNRCPTCGRRWE
jgi:hypothetical protein